MSYWTLIWRHVTHNRLRTLLTSLAIAFSVFLVCAVLTLPSVRDEMLVRSAGSLRLIVHHKAGLGYWLPLAHIQRVRALPHVLGVNHWSWFGGVYTDPKDQFPNFAVDPETLGEVWADYDWAPDLLETFKRTRNGALVGTRTMEKFGWEVGDEITLRDSVFGLDLAVKIIGLIPDQKHLISTTLLFSRQYLEEALQGNGGFGLVTVLWVRIDQPQHVDSVMAAIDAQFRNSAAETATQTEHAYFTGLLSTFGGFLTIIIWVGFLVVAAVVLIAANTAAMGMRERTSEVAVLKTIGFRQRTIFGLLLSEGLLIAGLGGILGAGGAYLILHAGSSSWSSFLGPLSIFNMPLSVMFQGILLALLIGMLASLLPAHAAARRNVVLALRQTH